MKGWGLRIGACILGLLVAAPAALAGVVVSPHQYAWSNNVGYINFALVTVSDTTLAGYAWSANKGWIHFNPAQGGVANNGAGNLSGSAWGEQLGWIDFDAVSISPSTGRFSGTATSPLIGTLTFDCPLFCDVQTDWRGVVAPPPPPPPPSSGGGGGGGGGSIPGFPATGAVQGGLIGILDFNAMMVNWGRTGALAAAGVAFNPSDLNGDGVVDVLDFNILMVYWGATYHL